jgi:hypothetical protein
MLTINLCYLEYFFRVCIDRVCIVFSRASSAALTVIALPLTRLIVLLFATLTIEGFKAALLSL